MSYEPNYREALKQAFKLVWKNKSLWVFGILAALFVSPFGLGGFWGQLVLAGGENFKIGLFPVKGIYQLLSQSNPADFVSIVWLLEILLAVMVVIIFVSVCSQTSLIINTCEYYKKKTHSDLSSTWHRSYKYFWKILGLDILRKTSLLVLILFATGLWLIAPFNDFWTSLFLILSFTILTLLMMAISSIITYASGYAVIDNISFWQSLKDGVLLFKDHFLVSFEISLIMMALDIVLAAFISTIFVLAFIPASLLWFLAGLAGSVALLNFSLILSILTIAILVVLIGGFYNAFNISTWMYLFMKMHHVGIFTRIGYIFNKIFQR